MATTQTLSKKDALKAIDVISGRLKNRLDNLKWEKLYTNYLKENMQEEKSYDGFRSDSISRPITISQAAKLFAITQFAQYLNGDKAPDVAGYTYMRKSIFTAYSLVALYKEHIAPCFDGYNLQAICDIDYAYMMDDTKE